jgi:hypothetical protein
VAAPGSPRAAVRNTTRPLDCPAAQPLSGVTVGQHGTGFTVTRGTVPQPFDVEVLGVLKNGLAPGRDLVVVDVADQPGGRVIAQGGGIWAGMSGSPVYIGDKLLGSVSYGFSGSPSTIGGVTPAADIYRLLPKAKGQARTPAAELASDTGAPARVALPGALRRQVAARTGENAPSGAMQQLRVPLGVSGVASRRVGQLQSVAARGGLSVVAHPAGAATAPGTGRATARPTAGGNFAAVASYGDVSLAAVGTTTAVCHGQALAFGHPFTFLGRTAFGASGATSLAIVKDPVFGSFKLADVGPAYGTLDADRFSGVRAKLGAAPTLIPLRTAIQSVDAKTTLRGRTDTADDRFLATATFYHVFTSIDSGFDQSGANHSATSWTITGTRANGKPFVLRRDNRWTDQFDTASGPSFELAQAEDTLLNNDVEAVRIQKVDFKADVSSRFDQETLVRRLVAVNGGALKERDGVTVRPGDRIHVRAVLRPYRSATTRALDYTLTVPKNTKRGDLTVDLTAGNEVDPEGAGGAGPQGEAASCLLRPGTGCARRESAGASFDSVLRDLRSTPQNNALTASLSKIDGEGTPSAPVRTSTKLLRRVVTGSVDPVAVTVR